MGSALPLPSPRDHVVSLARFALDGQSQLSPDSEIQKFNTQKLFSVSAVDFLVFQ